MKRILFSSSVVTLLAFAAAGEPPRLESTAGSFGKPLPLGERSAVTVSASYGDEGYAFQFSGKGGPDASAVGGALTFQFRPGLRNGDADDAPVAVRFLFEGKKGRLVDLCRGPQLYGMRRHVPYAVFESKDGKWSLTLRAPWSVYMDKLPFSGKNPRAGVWRMTAVYRDAAGVEAALGSAAEPVHVIWVRPKPALQAFPALIADKAIGAGLWDYYGLWNWSWKEHWLGYPDAGVETFRWREAESETLFHTRVVEGIRREVEPDLERLRTDKDDPDRRVAEILQRGTPEEKNEILRKLPALTTLSDRMTAARRDYFLDRFAGRPIVEPSPEKVKKRKDRNEVLKPAQVGGEAETEEISLED